MTSVRASPLWGEVGSDMEIPHQPIGCRLVPSQDAGAADIPRRWIPSTGHSRLAAVLVDLLLQPRPGGIDPLQAGPPPRLFIRAG